MTTPTRPGQKCRVVGGRMAFNGEGKGPNQDKIVTTVLLLGQAGVEQENVWQCKSTGGEVLQTYYGAGPTADFLECWLEVAEPDAEPPATLKKERELLT